MRRRSTTLSGPLIATALTCTWLGLAVFPSGASACVELECSSAQTAPALTNPTIVHQTIAGANTGQPALPIALAAGALLIAIAGQLLGGPRHQDQSAGGEA
jgi:hypothetical protein